MAFNVLLDEGFPTSYQGYTLNTDFRVGIRLSLLQEDNDFSDELKLLKSFELLYRDKVPDFRLAIEGLEWFMSCGRSEYVQDDKDRKSTDKCIDFRVDQLDIWGAFWAKGVDLTKVNMHWFKFMSALANLGDCPITHKMSYRGIDLSKLSGSTRKYYAELKEEYRIKELITKAEAAEHEAKLKQAFGSYWDKLRKGV